MAPAIAVSPSLTSLLLGDNNLGDDGVEALSVVLKESKSLATLDLSNMSPLSTKFGPKGAAALASAIAGMASVTKILVGGNKLGDEGTIILCDALRVSTVSKVQELGLSSNDIGPDGAKAVAALFAAMASLTSVR